MRVLKQSPSLREQFQQQIEPKVLSQRQIAREKLGGGFFGVVGAGILEFQQFKNEAKGSLGENLVSLLAMSLPDTWVMFNNAFIPTSSGKLTEIDVLLIGSSGVFLIEVKTWKGSFAAYRDKWKRREKANWIPLDDSPTQQSLYHRQMFHRWITHKIPDLPNDFIIAPVVFPIAKWLGVTECSVPVFQGFQELRQLLEQKTNCLTPEQVLQISEAIEDFEVPDQVNSSKPKPTLRKSVQ